MTYRSNSNELIINSALDFLKDIKSEVQNICVNIDIFPRMVNEIAESKGKVVTTGMGKAGLAMKKFAAILNSIGVPACYIHPGEASHGDLGVITNEDILFVASTSGKTREVLETIDLARNINVRRVFGITSHSDSPIREKADLVLDMGQVKEVGILGLAPTTSIIVMLILTDCLAMTIAEVKNLTKEEYGKYHHGGYLGMKSRGDENIY